jgi:hypothetical protein
MQLLFTSFSKIAKPVVVQGEQEREAKGVHCVPSAVVSAFALASESHCQSQKRD